MWKARGRSWPSASSGLALCRDRHLTLTQLTIPSRPVVRELPGRTTDGLGLMHRMSTICSAAAGARRQELCGAATGKGMQ